METNKYKVVEKEIKGIDVIGLTIENSEGSKKNINLSDAIKLSRGDTFSNAHSVFDSVNSEYRISIDGGLDNLATTDRTKGTKLRLVSRIINSENVCVGYKAQDTKGKVYKLSISKIWELAEQGSVIGIEAKVSKKGKVLLSTDECKLDELPIFRS
jgi:hypothetical protein